MNSNIFIFVLKLTLSHLQVAWPWPLPAPSLAGCREPPSPLPTRRWPLLTPQNHRSPFLPVPPPKPRSPSVLLMVTRSFPLSSLWASTNTLSLPRSLRIGVFLLWILTRVRQGRGARGRSGDVMPHFRTALLPFLSRDFEVDACLARKAVLTRTPPPPAHTLPSPPSPCPGATYPFPGSPGLAGPSQLSPLPSVEGSSGPGPSFLG